METIIIYINYMMNVKIMCVCLTDSIQTAEIFSIPRDSNPSPSALHIFDVTRMIKWNIIEQWK